VLLVALVWNAMGIRFRTRAGISGLLLVDLQIGNTDWVEAKEWRRLVIVAMMGFVTKVVTKSLMMMGASGGSECTVEKTAALTYGVPPQLPLIGFFIGVYAQSDTEGMALIRRIEPPAT